MEWLDGTATIFAGDKPGRIERWTVDRNYQAVQVDELSFRSQIEGCVVDAPRNTLYVGEETVGIWAIKLDGSSRGLIDGTGRGRLWRVKPAEFQDRGLAQNRGAARIAAKLNPFSSNFAKKG